MKKFVAISLLSLFVFNLIGYRLVFNYAQHQSDVRVEAMLDEENYNDQELVELQVPISMPYQNDRAEFERVSGEISYQGKIYKYVKRKMEAGKLVLLCLPDQNKMRLQSAKDDFFRYANDIVQNNHSKKTDHSKDVQVKNAFSDYVADHSNIYKFEIATTLTSLFDDYHFRLTTLLHTAPWQPPESKLLV